MLKRRLDVDDLLKAIIAEAEVALRRKNFEDNIRHIHLAVHTIERRIRDFWWAEYGSAIERLIAEHKEEPGLTSSARPPLR